MTRMNRLAGMMIVAGLSALVRVFDGMAAPIVAAAAVVPIVALAPVLYTMFGANVETARQLVAALAVFVPVYVNTLRGLRQAAVIMVGEALRAEDFAESHLYGTRPRTS